MSSTPNRLLGEALHLPVKERTELAAAILASLDGEPEEGVERLGRQRRNDEFGDRWRERLSRRTGTISTGS